MITEEILKNNEGTIVDVRTPGEFRGGSVSGAVNVPLNEIPLRLEELKEMKSPLILCCASGRRSGIAKKFLIKKGFPEVYNGGGWMRLQNNIR